MKYESKTSLVCGTAICINSHLSGLISHSIRGPTKKLNLIQLAVLLTRVMFLLYFGLLTTSNMTYIKYCLMSHKKRQQTPGLYI